MLLRSFIFFIFFLLLDAKAYPQTFAKMSIPLFKASVEIENFSDIKDLEKISKEYVKLVDKTLKKGFNASSDKEKKEYLNDLRKLEKKYNFFLYKLHKNIDKSIKDKNYEMFFRLTSYEFDGLLQNTTLLQKSIEFYKNKKTKKVSKLLESKIAYKKLLKETLSEFPQEIIHSTYSSSNKDTSTKKVYIFAKEFDKYIAIFARNKTPYTITMNIDSTFKNLHHKNLKQTFTIKTESTIEYTKLYKQDKAYSYSFNYSWLRGSIDANHDDDYLYRLPFEKGTSHRVSQGFNTKETHKGSNRYAVDFAMSCGTKICAARDGVVVDIKKDSKRGGYSKEFSRDGNFITIEHSDETMATYYHLKKNGVIVKLKQKVKRGQHIGYSGNTGYSSGPHLHFQVFKARSAKKIESIPIKFISAKGVVKEPKRGTFYKAK
jgi:murein DD-endopeptidase MepM/ murein hydrolase activator NlpD